MSAAHTHVGKLDRMPSDRSRKLVFLINVRRSTRWRELRARATFDCPAAEWGMGIDNESDQVS